MSKTFKVEHNDWFDNPTMYITLHNPPYNNEMILSRTKWKIENVTITEVRKYQGEEK